MENTIEDLATVIVVVGIAFMFLHFIQWSEINHLRRRIEQLSKKQD